MNNVKFIVWAGIAACLLGPTQSRAIEVSAIESTPTLIGTLTAGDTYTITASGVAYLCSTCDSGGPLSFTANGKPTYDFAPPYSAFYPNGLDHDPTGGSSYPGTGGYGQGGEGKLLGALLGTFTATPSGPSEFFYIGLNDTVIATANESLYAVINDTYYADNSGGYSVNLSSATPEPSVWALMLLGLGAVGGLARRRRAPQALTVG